jgi:hypothetical protein
MRGGQQAARYFPARWAEADGVVSTIEHRIEQ